jgi:hypothetical protein
MATTKTELEFRHFVVDKWGVIFASARDKNNKVYNFIINGNSGTVMEQINSHFECITGERAEYVKKTAAHYYGVLPTYRVPHFELS